MSELTARTIAAMKPGPRREIPDGRIGSLYLVAGPKGAASWILRYRRPDTGRHAVLTLGRVYVGPDAPDPVMGGHLSLAGARRLALEAKIAVEEGRDPGREKSDAKTARREAMADTFGDALDEYARRHLSNLRTGEHVRQNLALECAAWLDRPARSIARRDVIHLLDEIVDRGSPVKANRTRAYLSAMFGWMVQREIVDGNPVRDIPKPTRERARDRVHTDEELAAVWDATDRLPPTTQAMARVLVLTGQRLGSVEAMRWSDVDLEAGVWTVPAEDMKMARDHIVPLAPAVMAVLRELPRDSEYVFAGRGGGVRNGRSKFRVAWVKASGIEPWTIHDLRRTLATGLQRLGVRLEVVEAILAHEGGSRAGVVGVYQRHHWADEKRHALNAWADHVMTISGAIPASEKVVPLRA